MNGESPAAGQMRPHTAADYGCAIDFGTSNSAVVAIRTDGTITDIRDPGSPRGELSFPSSVCIKDDGKAAVGAAAERLKLLRPEHYCSGFKAQVGQTTPVILGDFEAAPHELVAEVLRALIAAAETALLAPPTSLILTVPAAWERTRRDYMLRAVAIAGFDRIEVQLLTEPEAAAQYAMKERPSGISTALVYDLGGGTFDCAVIRISGMECKVLGRPGGLPHVGGRTFDARILQYLGERYPDQTAEVLSGSAAGPDLLRRRIQLRESCEQLKVQLSIVSAHEEYLTALHPPMVLRMERAELVELLSPFVLQTIGECERLLDGLGKSWSDIDAVIPVGGSSRLIGVHEMLVARSGRPLVALGDPERAVVRGAGMTARRSRRAPLRLDPNRNLFGAGT